MSYIGNEQQWKQLIEVDWLGQYVKAWIAFNAWYRNSFNLKEDWRIIDAIKNDEGDICSKIENFLSGNGSDQETFRSAVADLHRSLSDTVIKSKDRKISFETIEDYGYANSVDEIKNKVSYRIEIDIAEKKRLVTITKSNGMVIYSETINRKQERDDFDLQHVDTLSHAQKGTLGGLLKESSPIHDLLHYGSHPLEVGSFKFINNPNLIARAIIEVLYELRNALFHGEITPDSKTQRIYQPAYLILKSIIPT